MKNKKILITGHTGFIGSWLAAALHDAGADIAGFSLNPKDLNCFYEVTDLSKKIKSYIGDIRDPAQIEKIVSEVKPEVVFHLAAQALVSESYHDPLGTAQVNILGTMNLLSAIKRNAPKARVVVSTSDKVYQPSTEINTFFTESSPLGGNDIYSASKACQEIMTAAFSKSFFIDTQIRVATVRCGNVLGGGDRSENRIIPDLVRSLAAGKTLRLRYPHAVRPWQHVFDAISGFLYVYYFISEDKPMTEQFSTWNVGPNTKQNITVQELAELFIKYMGHGEVEANDAFNGPAETKYLNLNTKLIAEKLSWAPKFSIDEVISVTADWYKHASQVKDPEMIYQFSLSQWHQFIGKQIKTM